jgi:flotillin
VLEAQYVAQARAAEALAAKVEKEKRAELEAVAKAEKAKVIVDAEAAAEQRRIAALAEADAVFAKLDAEARGQYEILAKKAEGLRKIVEGCGGAQQAFQLLMLEHIEKLSENAANAIANIKFDKIVVWDSGGKDGGRSGTANFLHGLAGSLPPMLQMMKDVGGVDMPDFLGRLVEKDGEKAGDAGAASGGAASETDGADASATAVAKKAPATGAPKDSAPKKGPPAKGV